ncbi:MAG TPA: hypothetical protein VMT47_11325 [Polyangia bacterium]|jgi:hypothetical protein|nr:hypothetical protein [Polyangia bacterium]
MTALGRALCSLALAALLVAPSAAGAKPGRRARPAASTPVAERSASVDKPAPVRAAKGGDDDGPSASAPAKTADGKTIKTKTYTFGAMDVEGKLKTPQLLYFLNRVKLELDMSAPDKRSFMKELAKSADDKSL